MTSKNKTIKFISALLIFSILAPSILFSRPKKVNAMPVFDAPVAVTTGATAGATATSATVETTSLGLQIKDVAKEIGKQLLMTVARRFLQEMTKGTINWINSGFHGSPLFLENPESFFKDIAKYEIKTMVDMFGYDLNRFPYGKDFALNTINSYKTQLGENAQYTLSKVMTDPVLLHNYQNNFNVGGWNAFLINTQYPQNNYLGFQMLATEALARKVQGTVQNNAQKVQTTLQQGLGFLSPETCPSNPEYNKVMANAFQRPTFQSKIKFIPPDYTQYDNVDGSIIPEDSNNPIDKLAIERAARAKYQEAKDKEKADWIKANTCPGGLVKTTPGSVVANQITSAMGSKFRETELAGAMGNSISAILDSLLNKFMGDGLTALASTTNPKAPVDEWSYEGQTLGSPAEENTNSAWDVGPDEPILIDEFKEKIDEGIKNTNIELALISNSSNANPGITQMMSQIWPQSQKLDMCQPGPDIGWEDRMTDEMTRNSKKLQEKASDDDGEKSAQADLVLKELKFAVNFFKDWINNNMMTELPNSVLYMDAVDEIETLSQQADELTDKRRIKNQALARLQSIKTALASITTQPRVDSAQEKIMISLYKQYKATSDAVSNTTTIDNAKNELAIAKEKLINLKNLTTQCEAERKKGNENGHWTASGSTSTFINTKTNTSTTEKEIFCDAPIKGGYNHESFTHENDDEVGLFGRIAGTIVGVAGGGVIGYKLTGMLVGRTPIGAVTHPEIPYVNAKDVLKWRGKLGLFGHSASIQMSCNIIWKANVLDYKGNLPGTTTQIEEENIYAQLPNDEGSSEGVCTLNGIIEPVQESECATKSGTWTALEKTGTCTSSTIDASTGLPSTESGVTLNDCLSGGGTMWTVN